MYRTLKRLKLFAYTLYLCVSLYSEQGCTNPAHQVTWRLNILRWLLTIVVHQNGPSLTSPFWRLEFWGGSGIFGTFVHPSSWQSAQIFLPRLQCRRGFFSVRNNNFLCTIELNLRTSALPRFGLLFIGLSPGTGTGGTGRSYVGACEICHGISGNGTGFSPSAYEHASANDIMSNVMIFTLCQIILT
jgi:hypothetical protein